MFHLTQLDMFCLRSVEAIVSPLSSALPPPRIPEGEPIRQNNATSEDAAASSDDSTRAIIGGTWQPRRHREGGANAAEREAPGSPEAEASAAPPEAEARPRFRCVPVHLLQERAEDPLQGPLLGPLCRPAVDPMLGDNPVVYPRTTSPEPRTNSSAMILDESEEEYEEFEILEEEAPATEAPPAANYTTASSAEDTDTCEVVGTVAASEAELLDTSRREDTEDDDDNDAMIEGLGGEQKVNGEAGEAEKRLNCVNCGSPRDLSQQLAFCKNCFRKRHENVPRRPRRKVRARTPRPVASPAPPPVDKAVSRADEQTDDADSLCIICFSAARDTAFLHGRRSHLAACYGCARKLVRSKRTHDGMMVTNDARCPLCRRAISAISRIISA